jgi:ABC-type multidrug transport system fused ATPase/permease subunit
MIELYRRIWTTTWRDQLILIVFSLLIAALAALPLQFQKTIINGLTDSMDRNRLVMLCAGYVGVIILSRGLRFAMDYRAALLSQNMIRKIRNRIYEERMTVGDGTTDKRGAVVTMIASEAADLGRFAGEAIAEPLLHIGTLVSVIAFIASTEPYLGLLLLFLIFPQALIVLFLQKKVNQLVAKHLQLLRRATNRITEKAISITQQAVLDDFDEIFETQRNAFGLKLSMKFALNVLSGWGLVSVLFVGGLLLLEGHTDIGTVVASLTAFGRINEPWRALIGIYREASAVRVRYDLLVSR